jgi:hypothetical protein
MVLAFLLLLEIQLMDLLLTVKWVKNNKNIINKIQRLHII